MRSTSLKTIASPEHNLHLIIETLPEHHMGACTVRIIASRPIAGVSHFQTTNGGAFFDPASDMIFVWDAEVIVAAALVADNVRHLRRPQSWYFSQVRSEAGTLAASLYNRFGGRDVLPHIPLDEIPDHFAAGWGPVREGRFPSAFGV